LPFDPILFLKLAQELYVKDYYKIEEAARRTSISRAYYAVFLILRESIRNKLTNLQPMYTYFIEVAKYGLIHSCIREILQKTNMFMGKMYSRLSFLRKKSDYELNTTIGHKEVEEALRIAKRILEEKDILDKGLTTMEVYNVILKNYITLQKSKKTFI
jgi:uncharacterized protein (UPF0332 family)